MNKITDEKISELSRLKDFSLNMLDKLKKSMQERFVGDENLYRRLCVYACGSLGRLEMSEGSDLDLFFILSNDKEGNCCEVSNINKYIFFSQMHTINEDLHFPSPSKGGMYWDFICENELLDIGSRKEDYTNSLTARMLMLLESKPLYNDDIYYYLLDKTIQLYFSDYADHQENFYPMYLMNDILRYWYTLTLNYEYRRDPKDTPNEKYWKRMKLKFSRLLTCFSLLACLYKEQISPSTVKNYIMMTPFERLHVLAKEDQEIAKITTEIENEYEWFINLRITNNESWWNEETNKHEALSHAEKFHDLFIHKLMKYIAHKNESLHTKMDIY